MVKVKDIMTCEVHTIDANASIASAVREIGKCHVDCLAVNSGNDNWGIVTTLEIAASCLMARHDPEECRVSRHTFFPSRKVDPEMALVDMTVLIIEDGANFFPVVEDHQLVGIVTAGMVTGAIRRMIRQKPLESEGDELLAATNMNTPHLNSGQFSEGEKRLIHPEFYSY